jgi:acylphosphatase
MKQCERYRVKGRVQGVFFRAATRDQARRLGLTGFVRNLRNGDVEVVACGNRDDVQKLAAWLWQGPPSAKVIEVMSESIEVQDTFDDFVVR